MKKNLMIAMLFVSILMVSVVSAGITGYAISLKRGVAVLDDNLGKVSVQEVSGDTATFQFTDPNTGRTEILSGTEGQIVETSSGAQVEITGVTGGNVFKRGEVEVNVVPVTSAGAGTGASGAITRGSCTTCYNDALPAASLNGMELYALNENSQAVIIGSIANIQFFPNFVQITLSPDSLAYSNILIIPNNEATMYIYQNNAYLLEELFLKATS